MTTKYTGFCYYCKNKCSSIYKKHCSRKCALKSRGLKANPDYKSLHDWLNRNFKKPEKCECCGLFKKLDWALTSETYTRKITDYRALCRKCHAFFDGFGKYRRNPGKSGELNITKTPSGTFRVRVMFAGKRCDLGVCKNIKTAVEKRNSFLQGYL